MSQLATLEAYQIGWICALPVEAAAAQEMLDENFGTLEEQDSDDTNIYTLGRIGKHYIVIACLGDQYGMTSATIVANNMVRTFSKSVRVGLMVGIGGGIPSTTNDIRLGDIVISYPTGTCGGVLQHDMGKVNEDGKLTRIGSLNSPPRILLAAVNKMRTDMLIKDPRYPSYIEEVVQKNTRTRRNFKRPEPQTDRLFQIDYEHPPTLSSCDNCLTEWEVRRCNREDNEPQPHYGIIASGNAVIKHGKTREQVLRDSGALCFEMEAAGLMLDFPCIIIRGICDYADSHKNKQWQGYAALAAASYTKELLEYVPRGQVSKEKLMAEICATIAGELESLKETTNLVNQKLDLGRLQIAKGAAFDSHENQHDECLPGTRTELLREIEEWAISHGKCIFWLNGMAGTGKSTISQTVARRLKEKGLLGASFFFKRGEEGRGNAKKLFPTLIEQLATDLPQLIPEIRKSIEGDANISEKVLREQFERLFLQPLHGVKQGPSIIKIIVIDALDECEQEDDIRVILRLLPQVQKKSSPIQLRFLLTSRPELLIRLGFKRIADEHQDLVLHEIPKPIIKQDITLFLEHQLSEIRQEFLERGHGLSPDWPGGDNIATLVAMSVPLFIFAATICRVFKDPQWHPEDSLREVLSHQNDKSHLDGTYLPVLDRLLINQKGARRIQLIKEYQMVIGMILILKTPLPVAPLSTLASLREELLHFRLDSLHSVLSVPDDRTKPVRLFHLSFRDYLLDVETRNKTPLWIDEKEMSAILTANCLKVMQHSLKNIHNLPVNGTKHSEVNVHSIDCYLPLELQYSCHYWAYHLMESQDPVAELVKAFSFLKAYFLHWVEAMSVMGIISEVIRIIDRLQSIVQDDKIPEISEFLHDAARFILKNRQIADIAPCQLYSSGLLFSPRTSIIRTIFNKELPSWICRLPRTEESWSADLQTLEGHSDSVQSVVFSPDCQVLASGSLDQTIKLWDSTTGELQQTLRGHSEWILSLAFSSDGQFLASGSADNTIKLWDSTTGELRQTIRGHSDSVRSLVFSPDCQVLVSGSHDQTIKLWDPITGELQQTLEGHSDSVLSLAFSPDDRLLASGSRDNTIKLWDPITGKLQKTLTGHSDSVWSLAFSSNSQVLASGSDDNTIKLWDSTTGKLWKTLKDHSHPVQSLAFLPNSNKVLASGSVDQTIKLWDSITGKPQQTLKGHSYTVLSLAFSPDGRVLASGSLDHTIKLWDSDSTMRIIPQNLENDLYSVQSLAFSTDGRVLASSSLDHTIKLWDPITGKLQKTLEGYSMLPIMTLLPQALAFSSDNQVLASGCLDYTIKLWDTITGELQQTLEGHSQSVWSLAFSLDNQLLASGSDDNTIKLWDPATGELQQTIKGHSQLVRSLAFSPDGRVLASGSHDQTIKLWDTTTGELQHTLTVGGEVDDLSFSNDSLYLITNLGYFSIRHWYANDTSKSPEPSVGISILEGQWVCLRGRKLLWLPPEYRATCSVVKDGNIALGHVSGRVSFISVLCD